MSEEMLDDFPLFPPPIVLLPTEVIPLHIFEERYKDMIGLWPEEESEFGIVWLSDDGLKDVGCMRSVTEVLERLDDGRMNILVQGASLFRLLERNEMHEFPAGTVQLLDDRSEKVAEPVSRGAGRLRIARRARELTSGPTTAHSRNRRLRHGGERRPRHGREAGLLELRSEQARLRLLTRLFKDAMSRLDKAEKIAEHARGNGKVKL